MADEAAERVALERALTCLRLEVQGDIVDHIQAKARDALSEARQLALEEAAQIADSFRDPDRDTLGYQEAENIATTIRALKEPTR